MNFAHANSPGASIAATPTDGQEDEPSLELLVLGFVVRALHLPASDSASTQ